MDQFADERDFELLQSDRYTFFVLRQIMRGRCKLLLTDHERLILCFSEHPFPVWIWTPDDATEAEFERAYRLAEEHSLLNGEYRFNLKYALAEYFIKRAAAQGKKLSVCMNMLAYDCREPIPPAQTADGMLHRCGMEDLEELAEMILLLQEETGVDQNDAASIRRDAEAFIRAGRTFFWADEQGRHVASCKYGISGDMASVNLVYTRPQFRRKHYAASLVYRVTKEALAAGYVPMLYTDGDYTASNACYESLGYVLRGKLCTIG